MKLWSKFQWRCFNIPMSKIWKICACVTHDYPLIHTTYKFPDMISVGNVYWRYSLYLGFTWIYKVSSYSHSSFYIKNKLEKGRSLDSLQKKGGWYFWGGLDTPMHTKSASPSQAKQLPELPPPHVTAFRHVSNSLSVYLFLNSEL